MTATAWLDPVRAELDALERPTDVFFRDDEAGRRDDRLDALLGLFSHHGLACDVAVSPDALTRSTVGLLTGWALVDGVRLHQHGGQDVAAGRTLLRRELGELLDDVLTPDSPGCTPRLASTLVALGITAVVHQAGAAPLRVPGLVEMTTTVDWTGPAGPGRTRERLGRELAAAVAAPGAVGIGLHHVTADPQQTDAVGALLDLLVRHQGACLTTVARLAAPSPPSGPPPSARTPEDHPGRERAPRRLRRVVSAPPRVVPRTAARPGYYDLRTLSGRPSW